MSEAESETAETLVINHLADLEGAIRYVVDVLEPAFWTEVGKRMEDWSKERKWFGHFDPDSDEHLWFAPPEWHTAEGNLDDYDFWFWLKPIYGNAEEDDTTTLASFINASARGNHRGIVFDRNHSLIGKRVWRALFANFDSLLEQLREIGFVIDSRAGTISYPVSLDANTLGQALADENFDDALSPLGAALAKVEQGRPLFDQLIEAARASA